MREVPIGQRWGVFSLLFFFFFSLGSENADISIGERGEGRNIANNIHTNGLMLLLMEVTLSPSEYTQVLPFSPKTDRYEPKNIGLEKISWISKPLSQLLQEHVMIPVTYLRNNQGLGVFSCSEYLYCRAVPKLSSSDVLSAYFKFPSEIYSWASYTRLLLSQNCCLV